MRSQVQQQIEQQRIEAQQREAQAQQQIDELRIAVAALSGTKAKSSSPAVASNPPSQSVYTARATQEETRSLSPDRSGERQGMSNPLCQFNFFQILP